MTEIPQTVEQFVKDNLELTFRLRNTGGLKRWELIIYDNLNQIHLVERYWRKKKALEDVQSLISAYEKYLYG